MKSIRILPFKILPKAFLIFSNDFETKPPILSSRHFNARRIL